LATSKKDPNFLLTPLSIDKHRAHIHIPDTRTDTFQNLRFLDWVPFWLSPSFSFSSEDDDFAFFKRSKIEPVVEEGLEGGGAVDDVVTNPLPTNGVVDVVVGEVVINFATVLSFCDSFFPVGVDCFGSGELVFVVMIESE
jgi:hypothetical protein